MTAVTRPHGSPGATKPKPAAAQLPPPIVRREHDDHDQHDQDLEHMPDIDQAERKVDLARARLRAVRRGATLSDGAAIHEAERQLTIALNELAAAWAARLIRDGDAA